MLGSLFLSLSLSLSLSLFLFFTRRTSQQMRHCGGLDLRGRCPSERRRGLGKLLADAQGRELFDRRGRLSGALGFVARRRRDGLGSDTESAAARHAGIGITWMEGEELEKS